MKKNIIIFIKLLIWFGLIRNMLYFSTYISFNLIYILLLLGFKYTSVLWIIIIDILMVAFIINPHKTIHKIKSFYKSMKFPLLKLYLIYLIFYSAINIITFEPFFYESLYISSRIPFLIVLVASLYLGFQNFSFNSFYKFIVDTKKSIYSLLGIKSKAELKEEEHKNKVLEYQRQSALRKKYEELNNITIKELDTRKQFEFEFFYEKYAPNTLLTVKRELNKRNKERMVGAAMFINAEQLKHNKERIYNKKVEERSDDSRKSADVPGYDFLAKKFNYTNKNNQRIFIWHRTHLIPFRYTLSEGDTIDNLLFAGTAHLNSGDRPDIDYDVWSRSEEIDGRPQRKKDLREKFSLNQPIETSDEGIFEKYYKLDIAHDITVPGAPEDTYYSLADVEEVVDEIIMDYPNSDFAYGTILEYENDLLLAPRWCTAVLINKTLNKIVFYIKLSNVK